MRRAGIVLLGIAVAALSLAASPEPRDPWGPVRLLEGTWWGSVEGFSGSGTVDRTYSFVMEGRLLHERSVIRIPPQDENPEGEVHEYWSFFSRDRDRKTVVMRRFDQDGPVDTYVLNLSASDATKIVFESQSLETWGFRWKVRMTYDFRTDDEVVETIEEAQPDKPFEIHSRSRLKRAKISD